MMHEEIWANLCGEWVKLSAVDKVRGNLAYNWLRTVDFHDIKEEYIGVKHGDNEYVIHKSCLQLRFVNDN